MKTFNVHRINDWSGRIKYAECAIWTLLSNPIPPFATINAPNIDIALTQGRSLYGRWITVST